jgi:hypothetical protein
MHHILIKWLGSVGILGVQPHAFLPLRLIGSMGVKKLFDGSGSYFCGNWTFLIRQLTRLIHGIAGIQLAGIA